MLKRHANSLSYSRLVAIAAAMCLHSTSATAGNLTLNMTGFTAAVDLTSFSVGTTKASTVISGGAGSPANFQDASFTATESPAIPWTMARLIAGQRLTTAQLVVLSPTTGLLVSDWTFEEALVTSVVLSHSNGANAFPVTSFTLTYNKITYRVYATDGTIAQRSCWNVVSNTAC